MNTNRGLVYISEEISEIKGQIEFLSFHEILNDWPDTKKKLLEIVGDLDDIEKAIDYVVSQ